MTPAIGPSVLFCPGDRPDRFARAFASADTVVLDLEDGVGADRKILARTAVTAALEQSPIRRPYVRLNPPASPPGQEDLRWLADHTDLGVMQAKAESPDDIAALAPRPVIALAETARGILNVTRIAEVDNCVAVMWGAEDLTRDMGGTRTRAAGGGYTAAMYAVQAMVLVGVTAARKQALDAVFLDLREPQRLMEEARAAADAGFTGKAAIHPEQIEPIRRAFAPTPEDVEWARALLAHHTESNQGGAFLFRGQMTDAPILVRARRVMERAAAGGEIEDV